MYLRHGAISILGVLLAAASFAREAAPPTPRPARRSLLDTEKALYSHRREEVIIRDFFQDRRGGVFLDVGCAWPIQKNNTYYLEKHLDWSGLGVDALPEFAPAWKQRRPRSTFLNYLVSDRAETVEPFYRSELKGTSSATKEDMKGPAGKSVKFDEIRVPTTTLTKILDDHSVAKIDFLSMDIEGYELTALAGFDIGRFKPELLCVEAQVKNRQGLLDYFARHGYHRLDQYLKHDGTNWYFARQESP